MCSGYVVPAVKERDIPQYEIIHTLVIIISERPKLRISKLVSQRMCLCVKFYSSTLAFRIFCLNQENLDKRSRDVSWSRGEVWWVNDVRFRHTGKANFDAMHAWPLSKHQDGHVWMWLQAHVTNFHVCVDDCVCVCLWLRLCAPETRWPLCCITFMKVL